jgi:hypothetical protein
VCVVFPFLCLAREPEVLFLHLSIWKYESDLYLSCLIYIFSCYKMKNNTYVLVISHYLNFSHFNNFTWVSVYKGFHSFHHTVASSQGM